MNARSPSAPARRPRPAAKAARPAKAASAAPAAAAPRAGPGAPADDADGQPRYLQVARELKSAIERGDYPVGAKLPTELELCERFGISRFTAREAVRMLSSAGLVSRRQRAGTVVIARPGEARYTHDVTGVRDLFQYAQDTELRFVYVGKVALGREQARAFGAEPGEEWIYALGVRREGVIDGNALTGRPICVTRLFLNPALEGIEAALRATKVAVYALIERDFGVSIDRVDQELQGAVLDAEDAANLAATPGAPALRIVRRYYDRKGRLLEVADNVHPADRFTYRMQLRK